mgnify:CR=1 FL=1
MIVCTGTNWYPRRIEIPGSETFTGTIRHSVDYASNREFVGRRVEEIDLPKGATIGAVILFLLAQSAFGATLAARGGPLPRAVQDGLARDGFNYLLAIRLIPIQ